MTQEFDRWKAQEAAEYLNRVRASSLDLRRIQDEIEVKRSFLPSMDYTREKIRTSLRTDALEETAMRIFDLIDEFLVEQTEYIDLQLEAHAAIKRMRDARYRAVLTLYYLDGHSWETVGKMLNYETQTVKNLRGEALPHFWDVMPIAEKTQIPRAD